MLVKIMSVIVTGVSNNAMNAVPGCSLVVGSVRAPTVLMCLSLFSVDESFEIWGM